MKSAYNYRFLPSTVGIITTVCLIIRCLLSIFVNNSAFTDAANTVLAMVSMTIAIHLIRCTAGMKNKHIWNSISLILLILIPILNLLITAYNILFDAAAFMNSQWFTVALLILSFPSFFCYFFIYVHNKFANDKRIKTDVILSAVAAFIYVIPRLLSVFGVRTDLISFLATNSYVSPVIYVIELICFIIAGFVFKDYVKSEFDK